MYYELLSALEHRELVRLEREEIRAEPVTGYPLALSGELVLLQRLDDFDLAGYVLLRVADVTDVRHEDVERFTERVLRDEGQYDRIAAPEPDVPVGGWAEALEALRRSGRVVIVEGEDFEEDDFHIGRIRQVGEDAVIFHHFDAVGVWDDDPTAIAFDDITRVRFDERYARAFLPYIGEPPGA